MQIKTLVITEGETPPEDTPQKLKNLFLNRTFWRELEKAYYQEFPEEWDKGEWFGDYKFFGPIVDRKRDYYIRKRWGNECVKDGAILDDNLRIWQIGQIVNISSDYSSSEARKDSVVGRIKLIRIEEGDQEDRLIFSNEQ